MRRLKHRNCKNYQLRNEGDRHGLSVKRHKLIMLMEMGLENMQIMIMELAGIFLMLVKEEVELIKTGQSSNFRDNGVMI